MKNQELINGNYIEGKKSFEYAIEKIWKDFNWDKVHKTMICLQWNWTFDKSRGIPDINTIKSTAFDLLSKAYEEECSMISGGFIAEYDQGDLHLSFVIEAASSE